MNLLVVLMGVGSGLIGLLVLIALLIAEPLVIGGMLLLVFLWVNHTWRKVKAQQRNQLGTTR